MTDRSAHNEWKWKYSANCLRNQQKNDKTGNKELLLSNNINNAHAHRKREVRYDTNWTKLVRLQCQNYDEPG